MFVTLSQNASCAISELIQNAPKVSSHDPDSKEDSNSIAISDICVRIRIRCFG